MSLLDSSRFIYSLAGELISRPWNAAALKTALRRPPYRPLRIPKFIERLLAAFPAAPKFHDLVAFLRIDSGLTRALSRGLAPLPAIASRPTRHLRKMDDPPVRLSGLAIPKLPTESALAEWFGIDSQRLRWLADVAGRNRKHRAGPLRTYRHRWIPRRNGPPRLLEIPRRALKLMQRKLLAEILNPIPVHPAAHGFCAGRSIVTNASVHCGKSTVLRFDLADFFPSISSARVFQIFRTIGYPARVARLLTGLCTTQLPADVWEARPGARAGADFAAWQRLFTRHLPQGAPASPALANLAAGRLDRRLAGLATRISAAYSRYSDDLTFSGGANLARASKRLATVVSVIAHEEGFTLNHRKSRIMRAGVRQHVTGVVVNIRPNIARSEFDRLKAILTNCVRQGPASQNREERRDFRAYLTGKIAHVSSVHPGRGAKLKYILDRIDWK